MNKKIILLSLFVFFVDFLSKIIVKNLLKFGEIVEVIPNFFSLTFVYNDGAAFSILKGKKILFIIIGLFLIIYLIIYLRNKKLNNYQIIYYSLLIGGVIGNLIDRIIYPGVIDFLAFKIFNYQAPIFNLADTFIVISIFLIIIETLRGGQNAITS